ncbi:unnamed protein product, partial [Polarella glacialis]
MTTQALRGVIRRRPSDDFAKVSEEQIYGSHVESSMILKAGSTFSKFLASSSCGKVSFLSNAGLLSMILVLDLPRTRSQWTALAGVNVFMMALTAFLVQLAVVSGIALTLSVLDQSKTAKGDSIGAVQLMYGCAISWAQICIVSSLSYLSLGLEVFPDVTVGGRALCVVRVTEWLYTVPQIWLVYSKVYTSASEKDVHDVSWVLTLMITTGWASRVWHQHVVTHATLFLFSLVLFALQAKMLWRLPPHQNKQARTHGRAMFWMAQSLMTVYPVAWIAADLGFMSPVVEQVWVYTVLDVTCKLAFVWGCIVIRLAEAFPAMHVSFAGCHQVLDASYDIRLTMDKQFQISGLHGKKALLQHYVGESEVVGKNFLDLWLVESERTKVIDVMRMLDQNGGETLSPKVTLTLKGKAGNVSIECVVSSMQSGLRMLAINFVSQSEGDDASCNSAMDDRLRSACTPRFSSKDQGDSDSPQEAGEPGPRAPGPKGRSVSRSHEKVGFLLDDELEPAFLADVLLAGCPIIGVSEGFLKLSLYPRDKVVGTSISFLEEGIPEYFISKSTAKNLKSYCEACRLCLPSRSYRRWSGTSSLVSGKSEKTSLSSAKSYRSKASVGDILVVQPNRRQDSSLFVNSCYCSLVILRGRPYILGVPSILGEGALLRAQPNELEKNRQESRLKIQTISDALQTRLSDAWGSSEGSTVSECSADSWKLTEDDEVAISQEDGLFNWFSEQLQDHCILLNWNRTAVRREHADLPIGCLVFSRLPVPWTTITGPSGSREGLRFSVRVDEVTNYFDGLPLMGFTEREPKNGEDLYPKQAQCLGRSVLIGRNGLAFARDKWTHTQIGFKQPPQDELQTWREDPVEPATPSQPLDIAVDRGDTLECCWTVDGWLCMKQGEKTISSFNIGRSPQRSTAYYA